MTAGGQTAGDQAVRDRALDIHGSFIVQAPAGSGKTELLIQRYLNLLAHVREPEEIVAITFTRKAASEMRERIIATLRRAADDAGECDGEDVAGARLALARRAIANDRRRGWQLVSHPARLQIQTIDALCLSLTRQLPWLSGFAAPSGILDDSRSAYRRAAMETIRLLGAGTDDWRASLERFMVHVDNDMASATGLLSAMLASRDQWLRYLGGEQLSRTRLEAAWREVVDSRLERLAVMFPAASKSSLVACADAAAEHLAGSGDDPGARAWLAGDGFPQPEAAELPRWRFMADLLLTRSGQWRRKVNKNQGFPPQTEAKRAMQALLDSFAGDDELARRLAAVETLPAPGFSVEQAGVLDAMVAVLKLAVAQLQVVFEETGQVDFVEVALRAQQALGGLEEPSDLALKLDYRIAHLLVDEFQDTSLGQHRLLQLLTQGWTPDDGRTLFLVGDPMQSIYRFRQAEVGVFLEVWENGLGAVPVQPLRLSSNFRSAPAVVNWVNDTFSRCLPARPDIHSGAVAYAPSTPQRGGDHEGRVQVHPFVDCPEPQWAARLAELIGEALGRSDEVAVLVRARSHLAPLLPAFQARGIPYSGMDIAALIDEPVVRDLHSLTRALLHPGDRLAWLAVLRAPWCGLRLEDLLALPAARDTPVLWNALEDPQVLARLSPDGRARLARFCRALSGAAAQRGRMLLSRCVRWAWVELGGPALMRSGDHDHVHAYLQLLAAYQSGMNLTDEQAFDAALRGHWAHVEARPGAVQLMTVHRAKGLEFDEVFVPALERPTRGDDKRLLLWEETTAGGLLLATLSARGEPDDPHYRFLRALQAEKAANEDDRLLYVACTRARERLHLLGNLARRDGETLPPRRGSLLQRIWPSVGERFLEACPAAPEDAGDQGETGVTQPALRRLPSGWAPPPCPDSLPAAKPLALDEARVEFSWVGETARHVGVLVHELMQRIAAGDAAQWRPGRIDALHEDWRERLRHLGVPSRELEGAVRRTADAIRNVLADETAAWLLAAHEQAGNELELSVADNGRIRRLRIDRTFVDDEGVRWIVDYKTSAHEGGALDAFLDEEVRRYRDKLEFYARALRKLESRPIRLGLYFPLLRGWREWPYEG